MSRGATLRRRLVALAVLALAMLAGYFFWLRDSSLVQVREVEVRGATVERKEVTAAIRRAALKMTTLHVDDAALLRAVSDQPTVASIKAQSSIPHGLTVTITERPPVAVADLQVGGASAASPTAISADGFALAGVPLRGLRLPSLEAGMAGPVRLDPEGRAQAAVLGATPGPLVSGLRSARWDSDQGGVVVNLAGAPELRFGDGSAPRVKWAAAAALLADPGRPSATFIDVSVPGRPAIG